MIKAFFTRRLRRISGGSEHGVLRPDGYNRLTRCRYGLMLSNVNDAYIGKSLQNYGEYCQGEADLLVRFLRPGDWVIDAGANVGSMTLFFAHAVGSAGRVLALEPQRIVFQTLCANLALNSVQNVNALHAAAGAVAGTVKVDSPDYSRPNNFGGMQLGEWRAGDDVALLRIDDLAPARCNLIKIDVEGMEQEVLLGAAETIARHRPLLYVENDRPDRATALLRHVAALEYRIYRHVSAYFNADNFLGRRDNLFDGIVATNMLCIPRGSDVPPPELERVLVPA